MGGGNSKASGGGSKGSSRSSGSKGDSICGIDKRDIRSITHEYYDRNSKPVFKEFCIKGHRAKKWDCFVEHYRDSYPSGNNNGKGGEGRGGNSGSSDNYHESNRGGSVTQTTFVGMVLSEASKYGLNTPQYQSQVNSMPWHDLSKQYQNWKVLEKQITVGKVLSEADKYGLNSSVYQQQVNTMSDYELSKQYQNWKVLEKQIMVGKVLTQYSEAMGKSIDEIDEKTKSDLNNADQASLEKIYKDNVKNKQVVLVGTILSQVNQITGKPLNELDQETIDFANNSTIATLQLIYNTNVNQKQLLENGTVGLYELYFRLPVNVSYKILYNPGYFNSDMNKLLTRQLDLKNISNLNLSNNQIADDGAKVIADSLIKGEMPNLKKLHLEGNKITDEGYGFLIDTLKSIDHTISIVFKKVSGFSKEALKNIMHEMINIAKSNGISTQEVVTTQETIEHCKKGTYNVVQNIAVGAVTCTTPIGTVVDIYELNIPSLFLDAVGVVYPPAKVLNMGICLTEEAAYSLVDEDFANCLVGVTKSLEE